MSTQSAVLERYSEGANTVQPSLCCPVDYDPKLLELLPEEIVAKDYGCGDPSRYVKPGDTVLDLGSGAGKLCYMAAQLVGEQGLAIGVDMNDDMLALARKYQPEMAKRLGGDRVRFLKGYIQDLALDVEALRHHLAGHPIGDEQGLLAIEEWKDEQRRVCPLIPNASVDLVISNCVLNLVDDAEKTALLSETFRVLKPGGRIAISDIVSDEDIPAGLKNDPELWSGCISGAFQEQAFFKAFADAGFRAIRLDKWSAEPWQVINQIEFRSVTVVAIKGADERCMDNGHAVIYTGPYASVSDDEGHVYPRGERMAVCGRTFKLLTEGTYRDDFIGIVPSTAREPVPWCAEPGTRRPAAETKGATHSGSNSHQSCCG